MTPRNYNKLSRIAVSVAAALIFGSMATDAIADPFSIKHPSPQAQGHPPIALNDVVYRNSNFRGQPALISAAYTRETTTREIATTQSEPQSAAAIFRNEAKNLENTPESASLILIGTGIFGLAAGIRYRFSTKQNA
jgi:hypothetical protein